ncbi:PTS transporter subunit EIIC [Escherichia coli]|nr:zinc-binding dehydrogenase [Escherichia coli]
MENKSARAKVQAFGGFLTAMVIPNIGAFIAWGFITALFIPTGWLPNEHFAKIVGPMITYLLPVMIGSTGGHLVGGKRGAVMGGIGTIGVIVGAEIPMFLGSMIMGPLGGLVIKYVDKALEKRIPAGFEMVINNFSLGIAGMLLCLLGFEVIGPAVLIANTFVKECIEALVHAGYLPLLSVINEPAKVLFLNNAIDQGVYYPLGMQQASVNGKSIFFMVASNPGPGLGLLPVELAASKGIELVYVNTKGMSDPVQMLRALTGDAGFDDIFVYAAVPAVVEMADELLAEDGCLNFFAGPTDKNFKVPFNFYNVHYNSTHVVGTSGGSTDDMKEAIALSATGQLQPSFMVTHIGGLDAVPETVLNLPDIPGGKKLIYNGVTMPLTAIADFAEKGKTDPLFKELARLVEETHGIWNEQAEKYLLAQFGVDIGEAAQ